jgi:hypothetical protein
MTTRRGFLAGLATLGAGSAGAVALTAGSPSSPGAAQAGGGPFGSGRLGEWAGKGRTVSSDARFAGVVERDGIVMVGDSIGRLVSTDLSTRLRAAGIPLAADTRAGRPTAPAAAAVAGIKARFGLPSRVLVECGSNDVFDPAGFAPLVERVMRLAGAGRSVFWVEVQVCRVRQPFAVQVADQRNTGWINGLLWEAATRHPNLRIVPWSRSLAARPARLAAYLPDGVHPHGAGIAAYNATILTSLGLR